MSAISQSSYLDGLVEVKRISRSVGLLLCNSCYWCATELEEERIDSCPVCKKFVEAIPLQKGEIFTIDLDTMKGVT